MKLRHIHTHEEVGIQKRLHEIPQIEQFRLGPFLEFGYIIVENLGKFDVYPSTHVEEIQDE